jgi:DNA primase
MQGPKNEITSKAIEILGLKTTKLAAADDVPYCCPYHEDKTPSMFISKSKGIYNCFSCGRSGTIGQLFYDLTGSSLYKTLGIDVDEFSDFSVNYSQKSFEQDYSKTPKNDLKITEGELIPLQNNSEIIRYLRKRGISYEIAEKMEFSKFDKVKIGENYYYNRLMIPITEKGQMLSCEMRDMTGKSMKKVLYPKGSTLNTLYDLDNLSKDSELYIVEGLMDLAVLRSDPFFSNSTTIFGSNLTRRQLYLLDQFNKITFIPDNDKAGESTIKKALEHINYKKIMVLKVPSACKDVGDIPVKMKESIESLRKRGWLEMNLTKASFF